MRSFQVERHFPVPVTQVAALWRDETFLRALAERYSGGTSEPVAVEESGDEVRVRMPREVPADHVPVFLRKLVRSSSLVQFDTWPADVSASAEEVSGRWEVVTSGIPARLGGQHHLVAVADGCRHEITGEVSVRAPMVGGRAEEVVVREVSGLIERQLGFAADWLDRSG